MNNAKKETPLQYMREALFRQGKKDPARILKKISELSRIGLIWHWVYATHIERAKTTQY
jgi:hypothetical protein